MTEPPMDDLEEMSKRSKRPASLAKAVYLLSSRRGHLDFSASAPSLQGFLLDTRMSTSCAPPNLPFHDGAVGDS